MKTLYLTSIGLGKLQTLTKQFGEHPKIAFVSTAADPYKDKWFVEVDRTKLTEMGFSLVDVDIKNRKKEEFKALLNDINVIYFTGGNTFYLLKKIKESGLDSIIREFVDKGGIYAGASAGAVLACPTIEPVQFVDDLKEAPDLRSYSGLDLIDFVILPHYGTKKYEEKYSQTLQKYGNEKYDLLLLSDKQAVIAQDNTFRVVETD